MKVETFSMDFSDKQKRRIKRESEKRSNPDGTIDKDADLKDMVPGRQPGQIIDIE